MTLLYEYALTPDVFDSESYKSEELGTARLELMKDVFLQEALVRNLRDGEWQSIFSNKGRPWHRRGLELLAKLVKQNRLSQIQAILPDTPLSDVDWYNEALGSHDIDALTGIIATPEVVRLVNECPILGNTDRLGSSQCWTKRRSSVRLARCSDAYHDQLRLIMRHAKSVMFIDPHLNPTKRQYSDFLNILRLAAGRRPSPLLEIHRVIYIGTGRGREIIPGEQWKESFSSEWNRPLQETGLQAKIFIWDDFHDRYLISDVLGIAMGNGFDTSSNLKDMTTWTRLGRDARDDIQKEFDPATVRRKLQYMFTLPNV